MNKNNQNKNPIEEFYLASREYCKFVENAHKKSKFEFLTGSQKILSLIYLKASLLERSEDLFDGGTEKFVQEEDWTYIKSEVASRIGNSDKYIEVILPDIPEPDNIETEGLSDCFADIYQDLKDFVLNYEIDNTDSLLAGLNNCLFTFDKYWGPKLLAILSNVHAVIYSNESIEEDEITENSEKLSNANSKTDNWLINNRFNT